MAGRHGDALEGALHINWTGPTKAIARKPDGTRWCFRCRRRVEFEYTLTTTIEPSYYQPHPTITCTQCRNIDADLFPGRERHWD